MTETTAYTEAVQKIHARLDTQRAVIADLAAKGASAETLGAEIHRLARLEGASVVTLAKTFEPEDGVKHVTGYLLRGADDTWSGRGNDLKRAWFDGLREAARGFVKDY